MYKIFIETCGSGVLYITDIDLSDFFNKNAKFLDFPGLKIYKYINEDFPYYVKYVNSNNKKINTTSTSIEIYYPIKEITPASIAYMGYILMESQRANKSQITLHSACVEKEEKGVLLLGRSGSGKTTLAIDLCKNKDYKLIGNDRNIIGLKNNKPVVYDGTKFLFLRYESIKRNLPELLHLFNDSKEDSWLKKTKVLPEDIGIKESTNICSINSSYIIHIDNNQKDLYFANGDTPANRLFLNEFFSMYIRGMYTTFCDKNFHAAGYIPSYDNEEYYKKRINLINSIINDANLKYISGNIENVSEYIDGEQKILKHLKK